MRRSTAAAVGTLTGAALILGVRLTAASPVAAPPPLGAQDVAADQNARPSPSGSGKGRAKAKPSATPSRTPDGAATPDEGEGDGAASATGLRDGRFTGPATANPYGKVQVALTVARGRITNVAATYPTAADSARINADAIPRLKQSVIAAQSADIDSVSGATFTSEAYKTSLQAAFDAARG
jgi:uncharacterized protein with FMN-binding domain